MEDRSAESGPRKEKTPLEACKLKAIDHSERGDWDLALRWTRLAFTLGGLSDPDVWAQEADCLAHMGRYRDALEAYARADELDAEGYCAFNAAEMSMLVDETPAAALEWLRRALQKSPDIYGDILLFPTFAELYDDPRLVEMLAEAKARLGLASPTMGAAAA